MTKNTLIPMGLSVTIMVFASTLAYNASAKITRVERDVFHYMGHIERQSNRIDEVAKQLKQLNEKAISNSLILKEIKKKVK